MFGELAACQRVLRFLLAVEGLQRFFSQKEHGMRGHFSRFISPHLSSRSYSSKCRHSKLQAFFFCCFVGMLMQDFHVVFLFEFCFSLKLSCNSIGKPSFFCFNHLASRKGNSSAREDMTEPFVFSIRELDPSFFAFFRTLLVIFSFLCPLTLFF